MPIYTLENKETQETWEVNMSYEQLKITLNKDEDYIRESIVAPGAKKTEGYEQGVMAPYDYLSDTEIESLVLYIKSLSDN